MISSSLQGKKKREEAARPTENISNLKIKILMIQECKNREGYL